MGAPKAVALSAAREGVGCETGFARPPRAFCCFIYILYFEIRSKYRILEIDYC